MYKTHRFFDAAINLPEAWMNQTTVMFISPQMRIASDDDSAQDDDATVTQASLACRVVDGDAMPGADSDIEPDQQAKALLLQEISGMATQVQDMAIDHPPEKLNTDDDRALWFASVSGTMTLPVRQVIGVLVHKGRGMVMVGTCTQAAFAAVQDEMVQMLHSARLVV